MRTNKWWRPTVITLLLCCSNNLLAELEAVTLSPPMNGEFRTPKEGLQINFPSGMLQNQANSLLIELDAIDVTDMISLDGDTLLFEPLQPIKSGRHELRLIENTEEGEIIELASWFFEVKNPNVLESWSVDANSQLTALYRASEENLDKPEPDRMQGQGSSMVGMQANSENWQFRGDFDFHYNSLNSQVEDARTFDNGEFLLQAESEHLLAKVGHHQLSQQSFIMDNFYRRGISMEGRLPAMNSKVSGFSMSSEDIIGFGTGSGISDSNNRVNGVIIENSPFKSNPEALYLTLTRLDGRAYDSNGYYFEMDDQAPTADLSAWSFVVNSQLLDQRLQIRAELAESEYDFDINDDVAADKDDAYSLWMNYQDVMANDLSWNAGVETQEIGTYFSSLANQSLPADRHNVRIFTGLQGSSTGVQFSAGRQQDNVADINTLSRTQIDQRSINFNWSPAAYSPGKMGHPSLGLNLSTEEKTQPYTPENYLFTSTDSQTDNWQLDLAFNHEWWQWSLSRGDVTFDDLATGVENDYKATMTALSASFDRPRFSIGPTLQRDEVKYIGLAQTTTTDSFELMSSVVIIENKLSTGLNLNVNRNQVSDDSQKDEAISAAFSLDWILRQPHENRVGFNLGLSAQYSEFNDDIYIDNNADQNQVFLTLSTILPSHYGQSF